MISQEERKNAYKNASPAMSDAYGSMETAELLGAVRLKYAIPPGTFTDIVGDTILNLRQRGAFEQGLISEIGLTPEIARAVAAELKPLFDKASGISIPDANLQTKERLELRPTIPRQVTPAPITSAAASSKPLTREELMSALGAKRTMAQDMERARGGTGVMPPPPPPPSYGVPPRQT